jgi:hypothetical protein
VVYRKAADKPKPLRVRYIDQGLLFRLLSLRMRCEADEGSIPQVTEGT